MLRVEMVENGLSRDHLLTLYDQDKDAWRLAQQILREARASKRELLNDKRWTGRIGGPFPR